LKTHIGFENNAHTMELQTTLVRRAKIDVANSFY